MNKKTILIITTEIPKLPDRPVAGGGLRIYGISEGLKRSGYNVIYSISAKRLMHEKGLPDELKKYPYTDRNLKDIIKRVNPDFILKGWWGYEDRQLRDIATPIIFDLPAPRILEEVYHGGFPEHLFSEKIISLACSDYFICSSRRHKAYYLPYLVMSGAYTKKDVIEIVPHSTYAIENKKAKIPFRFIFGGVFWKWQNPVNPMNTLIKYMDRHNKGELHIFCGELPYKDKAKRSYFDYTPHLIKSNRVHISSLLPYDQMKREFFESYVAIDLMEKNIEREMSFSFRTLDYLSCGCPVITSNYSEWGELIEKYNAGWVVDPIDKIGINKIFDQIFKEPERVAEYSKNAMRLAKERFSYEEAIKPLLKFLKKPTKRLKGITPFENMLSMEIARRMGRLGLYKEAIDTYNTVTKKVEGLHLERAFALINSADPVDKKKIAEAEEEALKEEDLYPGKSDTMFCLGIIYKKCGQYKDGIKFLEIAIRIDHKNLLAIYNIASIYEEQGEIKDAKDRFIRIKKDKDASSSLKGGALFHLGKMAIKENNKRSASSYLKKCLKFIPGHKEGMRLLSELKTQSR